MKKRTLSLLLCLVMVFGLLAGCTPPELTPTPAPTVSGDPGDWIGPDPSATPDVAPTDAAASGPITVTDQAGRQVTLEVPAQKIVSGYYISTSACIALGLKDRMVGIENKMIPIYNLAAPEFEALPKVGTAKQFDLEGCLALSPDLVILPKKLKDAAETISQQGIPVLLVNPENRQQLSEMLTLIGKATGTETTATKLVKTYEDSAANLEALGAQLTEDQKPVVYLGGNSALLSTAPKEMYQATLIRLGGGVNAGDGLEGDSWTEVSYEQIIAMNPDVILLASDASYSVDDVKNDPQLTGITAVKEGEVYAIPGDLEAWDSPVPSCFLGSEWIMSTLHPELFSVEALSADLTSFYKEFYGADVGLSVK